MYIDIITYSNINVGDSLLEVGAGTGQASEYFAKQGYDLLLTEIGDNQIEYLMDKYLIYQNVCVKKC